MVLKVYIEGMSCAACSASVERNVSKLDGVSDVQVNLLGKSMLCNISEGGATPQDIVNVINSIGFSASLDDPAAKEQTKARKGISEQTRLWVSVPLLILLMYVAMAHMFSIPYPAFMDGVENGGIRAVIQFALTIPIVIVNSKFYVGGFSALWRRSPNMDSLVAVSSTAALGYSVAQTVLLFISLNNGDLTAAAKYVHNLYYDGAAMILTLVTVGKMLEERSKRRTGDAITKLMDLSPKTATCIKDGKEITVNTEDITVGDIILIHPGERIPVDGVVIEGFSGVDESAITGESVPAEKGAGSELIAGTVNGSGLLKMEAKKVGKDTMLAQIILMVENASATKAPIARLADKVAGVFVPIVMAIALVTMVVWLIAGADFAFALTNAISVLVISCPCALGLATPVAVTVAAGKCAEKGILIKSAAVLEMLHRIDTVILDKTGTITEGKPSVSAVYPNGISREELLKIAASLEKNSEHPLADAIIKAAGDIDLYTADNFEAVPGFGLNAVICGRQTFGGNARYMEKLGVDISAAPKDNGTVMFFAVEGSLIGTVYAFDEIKETSTKAIDRLKQMGRNVVMLTGDSETNAQIVKNKLGLAEAVGNVMPSQKADYVAKYKAEGRVVAMVGDGINDSPALAAADIGIAIGNGTDIAIDSADIVLTNCDLRDIPEAISLGTKSIRIIKQNLFWAFIYNIIGIPIAAGVLYPAFGILLSPMLGAACMCLSSLFVNLNALRIKRY